MINNQMQLPQSIEAEQAVLGAIIYDNKKLPEVAALLEPADFYTSAHQMIFRAVLGLSADELAADEITIGDRLQQAGQLDEAGGYAYLAELQDHSPASGNAALYATQIREASVLRGLISLGGAIQAGASPRGRSSEEVIEEAGRLINELSGKKAGTGGLKPIKSVFPGLLSDLERASSSDNPITGVPSGIEELDKITAGFQDSDLIILAARPAMGKTAVALNVALNSVKLKGSPAAIFSMEMAGKQLASRFCAMEGRVEGNKFRTGQLEADDWDKVGGAIGELSGMPIYLDDSTTTCAKIEAECLRLQEAEGLGLVIIDYLQLLKASSGANRQEQVSEISRHLKLMAKKLNVPVIALSQLNRALESRVDKRPIMSDLRESGAIEQDADLILFLYRDEVYNEDTDAPEMMEIIAAKHRNGPTGVAVARYVGKYFRVRNI